MACKSFSVIVYLHGNSHWRIEARTEYAGLTKKSLALRIIFVCAQALPYHNGIERIAELDENACQKRNLIKREAASNGVGQRRDRACQLG